MYKGKYFKLSIFILSVLLVVLIIFTSKLYNYSLLMTHDTEVNSSILKTYHQKDFFKRLLKEYIKEYNLKDKVLVTDIHGYIRFKNETHPSFIGYSGLNKRNFTNFYSYFYIASDQRFNEENAISKLSPVKVYDKKIFDNPYFLINVVDNFKEKYIDTNLSNSLAYATLIYYSSDNKGINEANDLFNIVKENFDPRALKYKSIYYYYNKNEFKKINKNEIKLKNNLYFMVIRCSKHDKANDTYINEYNFIIAYKE